MTKNGRALVTPALSSAYVNRPRTIRLRDLALASDCPGECVVIRLFNGDFAATKLNLSRLARIAAALKFKGATHVILTDAQKQERRNFQRSARDYYSQGVAR